LETEQPTGPDAGARTQMQPIPPGAIHGRHPPLLAIALLFALAYVCLSWGHIGNIRIDSGRWLHEVQRFSQGEVLYRDYAWPFPPMAMWILGGVARVFGSDTTPIWIATSIVFLLLTALYANYVGRIVEPALRLLALLAGLVLATAYANWSSAPLPTGMYSPAAPIGFGFLFAALLFVLERLNPRSERWSPRLLAACAGLLCGLAVLTKQDFWIPALLVVAMAGLEIGPRAGPGKRGLAASAWLPFLATVAAGTALVGWTAGWSRVADIVDGFGRIGELRGRHFPSWERLTIQLAGTSFVGLLVLGALVWGRSLSLRETRRVIVLLGVLLLAGSLLHVGMSLRVASDTDPAAAAAPSDTRTFVQSCAHLPGGLPRGAVLWWLVRFENNLFPLFFPAAWFAGLLIVRRRIEDEGVRRTLLFLGLLCLAARLRRGFEHVEWFHFLLEVPVAAAALSSILKAQGRPFRRGLQGALAALLLLGLHGHLRWGKDSLTARELFERVATPRGAIYLFHRDAKQYRLLQESLSRLDPSGTRPFLAFGYTGGFNYFLDRPNPTPLEEGFQFSGFPPDRMLDGLRASSPPPVLMDTSYYRPVQMPAPWLNLSQWELPMRLNVHAREDRPWFEKALAGCREFERFDQVNGLEFALFDCPPASP